MNCDEFLSTEPTEQVVAFNTRDAILYSLGVGEHHLRYVYENHDDFAVFPTYPIVLLFKGEEQDVCGFPSDAMSEGPPPPPFEGFKTVLDYEKKVRCVKPLPTEGGKFLLRQKLSAVVKKAKGALCETTMQLVSEDGATMHYEFFSSAFFVGAKNYEAAGQSQAADVKVPARTPDASVDITTTETQTHVYRLSGDYNPLHIDPEMARGMGFPQPILHGQCTMGLVTRAVLKAFTSDMEAERFVEVGCRFVSPVLPGLTLAVDMWREGSKIVLVAKVKETGKLCVANAWVELTPEAKM